MPEYLKRKREILNKYQIATSNVNGLAIADDPGYAENNHWMIVLQIEKESYGESREELMNRLNENKIQTRPVWFPVHLQKSYKNNQTFLIEKAEELVRNSLCLPSSTNLSKEDQDTVITHLKNG